MEHYAAMQAALAELAPFDGRYEVGLESRIALLARLLFLLLEVRGADHAFQTATATRALNNRRPLPFALRSPLTFARFSFSRMRAGLM